MYSANEALAVHAVAGSYRVRSHFEAQDCLESGADHRMTSGWLNRAVASLPPAATARPGGEALAVGVSVPLLLRGQAVVANWAPHGFSAPSPDLYATIAALNQSDPVTGPAIAEGLRARGFSAAVITPGEQPNDKYAFSALARAAGELLGAADGPRIAAMEIGGWDTHAEQANRLTGPLKQLDSGLVALRTALGPVPGRRQRFWYNRIRSHSQGQRHQGHRPWHRDGRVRPRGRRRRRPSEGDMAGPGIRPAV